MLDADTKRRIDSCRDMLVGKVPDPKSQVEQITIALIYKFMDDMDAASEELGGKRTFFAGEFERYAWPKLMAPSQGGFEMLALYSEAIARMNENPGVPELFRTIFKNAYLPYRDPETLRAFLKEINTFSYDHSEKLGDAFEYLLSVLGSQGDAGQFRTPRHIIDFLVEVVDPKKDERVLDPACGTAGFLISSYKHIVKQNTRTRPGDLLTADERTRLAKNFIGYDISPDMVRLSLVNLYLHGFLQPQIEEYDTLTQDEKWNEHADVILANPPFMSPKGGIKPHKRFSVQATRSEVLFVDYMAEHLTPGGRAGIVVPEGIIFQSGTAYKQLRKLLVDDFLIAVISLPAGVFQPYSGVKTSILVLDKRLAKRTESVLFVKIESDGFSLGAQRREIAQNDLETAKPYLAAWRMSLEQGIPFEASGWGNLNVVEKSKIAETGDYNLSVDRYAVAQAVVSDYELANLKVICDINPESLNPAEVFPNQEINYIDISCVENETGRFEGGTPVLSDEAPSRARRKVKVGDVLLSTVRPNLKAFTMLTSVPKRTVASTGFAVLRAKADKALPTFVLYMIRSSRCVDQMVGIMGKGAYPSINQTDVENLKIPLPPLDIQHEIVAEIEGYQKIIDGARQVVASYKPRIPVSPDWPVVKLAELCETITDGDHQPPPKSPTGVPFVTISNIGKDNKLDFEKTYFVPQEYYNAITVTRKPRYGDILYSVTGSYGIPVLVETKEPFCFQRHIALIRPSSKINGKFLYCLLASAYGFEQAEKAATGVAQKTVSLGALRSYTIPVPDLATQQAIVAEIEAEQRLVDGNKELIRRFEEKIKATINRVWGEAV